MKKAKKTRAKGESKQKGRQHSIRQSLLGIMQFSQSAMHFINSHYILCLICYVLITSSFVLGALAIIFKLLPSGAYSLQLNRVEYNRDAVITGLDSLNAMIYGQGCAIEADTDGVYLRSEDLGKTIVFETSDGTIVPVEDKIIKLDLSGVDGRMYIVHESSSNETEAPQSMSQSLLIPLITFFLDSGTINEPSFHYRKYNNNASVFSFYGEVNTTPTELTPTLRIQGGAVISLDSPTDVELYGLAGIVNDEPDQTLEIDKIQVPESGLSLFIGRSDSYSRYQNMEQSAIELFIADGLDDYELTADFHGSADITGEGSLYYSVGTNTIEYPLYLQNVRIADNNARLNFQKHADDLEILMTGNSQDVKRSGVSIKPSMFNWITESLVVFPTFFITVFGGAISISLKIWENEEKRKGHKAKEEKERQEKQEEAMDLP